MKASNMNLAEFARECIQTAFEGYDLSGGDIQELAIKHGLIHQVAFDPARHHDPDNLTKEGDVWFNHTDGFTAALAATARPWPDLAKFHYGDHVRKHSGSWWQGVVVGWYSTAQTPIGYGIQLDMVPNGSVQIFPEAALEPKP